MMEQQDSSDLDPAPPPQEVSERSSDAVSSLDEAFADLQSSPAAERDFQRHSETDGVSLLSTSPFSSGCMTRSQSDGDLRPKPKPRAVQPVKKQPKKADPVAKYHQYKQLWEARKPPGEADRRALRWETRNELAKSQIPHTRPA